MLKTSDFVPVIPASHGAHAHDGFYSPVFNYSCEAPDNLQSASPSRVEQMQWWQDVHWTPAFYLQPWVICTPQNQLRKCTGSMHGRCAVRTVQSSASLASHSSEGDVHLLLNLWLKPPQPTMHQLKIEHEAVISASRMGVKVIFLCASMFTCQGYVLHIFQGRTCICNTGSNLQKWKREKVRSIRFISTETSICKVCVCICFGWKCLTHLTKKIAEEIKSSSFIIFSPSFHFHQS